MNEATTTLPNINIFANRLLPGHDLKKELEKFAVNNDINAGWVFSAVGSLTVFCIRFADQQMPEKKEGHFEIVGLTGIISNKGSHLHIMVADELGVVVGGHLALGCTIYTTTEIIIGSTDKYIFDRIYDGTTSWKELVIEEKKVKTGND